jgi:hypothetical protein
MTSIELAQHTDAPENHSSDFDAQTLKAAGRFFEIAALPSVVASTEIQNGDNRLRLESDGDGTISGTQISPEGIVLRTGIRSDKPKLDIEL